jgi:putative membrane-bound dehydrogenase-like protein
MTRRFAWLAISVVVFAQQLSRPSLADTPADAGPVRVEPVDPYYPRRDSAKLITPRWVGEPGVEALVILAIDDMRDPGRYEAFLRPILNRLKKIDGRAPVSIMTNRVDPKDPRLQGWLKEGLSLECHTLTHPCPCLQKGDFGGAEYTYHGCVDLLSYVPGNKPVAFRMPCCDSQNTVSPRFFSEIFNKTSPTERFLAIDSSVFTVFTPDDPALPRELVFEPDGTERFRKYIPFPSFVNTIENYPYPYVIGRLCWEFPCMVPSDWEGFNLHKAANPKTLEDLKAALDCVVKKQGVFDLVFHPYGWIKSEQVVELIDYAVKKHGIKVKFLNFREALDRLNKNLLQGDALRTADGSDNHIRLIDQNGDGTLTVVKGVRDEGTRIAALPNFRNTKPDAGATEPQLPPGARLTDEQGRDAGLRLVDLDEDGHLDVVFSNDQEYGIYLFDSVAKSWSRKVMAGKAGSPGALPKIVSRRPPPPGFFRGSTRGATENGFFVHSRELWWQNEDTDNLPNLVDRRSFNDLLKNIEPMGKSPEASLKSIRVAPGFTVELVAAEPLVKDPIAFEWGADGKLWVVEMGDYPLGTDGQGKFGGVVRFLEDSNGDGRYDKATTFLDGLGFPTGVMPWRNGILVACAPDIFYAEDRDGDGKADHREVLFTGFVEGNQQHRLNGFDLGQGGWVYGANGESGGTVHSKKTGTTTPIQGRDFRFRPDSGEFEAESGLTQYGRHRDDWGRWFGNNNPNWAWHYVLADHDLKRNPHYAPPDPRKTLEPETRLFPVSRTVARFNDFGMANQVTSANSPTPYRDELFGPWYANSLFVSEPVHNLVHRMNLVPEGVTFRGRRGPNEAGREFLASSDNWFRPTMLKTGPDGALWIADMYRYVIEHPEWIPDDWEKRLDLRAGSEQGRIYRVYPIDKKPRRIPRLSDLDTPGLVAALDSPNGWQRDTAQRLLLHRRDPAAIALLRDLVQKTNRPKTRVQSIWTLADLDGLDEPSALAGLTDAQAEVRESVIEAARPLLNTSPKVAASVLGLAGDPEPRVRFRVALLLGDWDDSRAGEALAQIARRDGGDSWMRAAILSSAVPHVATLLAKLGERNGDALPPAIVERLMALAGSMPDRHLLDSLVRTIGQPRGKEESYAPWQLAALSGLLEARERAKKNSPLDLGESFARIWTAARKLVQDDSADEQSRLAAIRLLGHSAKRNTDDRDLLIGMLRPRSPLGLQQAAIAAVAGTTDPKVPDLLVHDWKQHSPQVRAAILDALLSRSVWTSSFLSSLEDGCVPPAEIDPARRQRLLKLRDARQRSRAESIFASTSKARQSVIDAYRPALERKGDRVAGAAVFKKLCASCHRLGNEGVDVGPDLAALNDKAPESLMIAILDPNRAFETRFAAFAIATVDGRVLTGLIASESATAVTLRQQDGKESVLLRSDIQEMTASGQSLMPEGVEKDVKPADLADLIAFITSVGPTRKPE